jgi:hypothetical protein
LEEPLKQAIKLGHELVFYFQLFVQMIEGNEVTKLLVTRLASLLWRLRRAVTIESGLLSIRAGIIRDQSVARPTIELNTDRLSIFRQFLRPGVESQRHEQRETN